MAQKRWKLTIEYDGTPFSGWQKQDNAQTVQGAIEEAFYKFCQQDVSLQAAGRTDAGVHAMAQIAHFDLDYGDRPLTGFDLCKALNAHLWPKPVSIIQAQEVGPDFNARFDAKEKTYHYRILVRPSPPALDRQRVWFRKYYLDVPAMREGAKYLCGHHDFTSFRDSQCQAKSPVRTLERLDVEDIPYDSAGGREIRIIARAQSFLHHQVRNMAGTLVLVGEGKWTPQDVRTALEAKSRPAAGPTAPARGLYLVSIQYE